jgi:hypothetical protein
VQGLPTPSTRPALVADVAIKLATVGLLVWAVLSPDLLQFQGKAFTGRAIAYPVALLILPIGWWLFGRRRIPFPVAADILFGLPFLIDVAGNALNLYDTIWWWDDANHLVNWAILTAGASLALSYLPLGRLNRFALGVGFGAVTAIGWELAEYVTFIRDSPELATAYTDTLGDLLLGTLGAMIGSGVVAFLLPARDLHSES